jgi:hypothetical protein
MSCRLLRALRARKMLLILVATALTASLPLAGSQAATPSSGTISASSPSVSWSGPPMMVPTGSANCGGPDNPACDNFRLTIQPPPSSFNVEIKLQPFAAGDWDLQVYAPNGGLAGSSGNAPGVEEVVTLVNPAAGTYTVSGAPFAPAPGLASYTASATIKTASGGGSQPPPGAENLSYATYLAPKEVGGQSAGEPSIGQNWKSRATMYQAGLDALRVTWDDCASPGTPTWKDVSFPTSSSPTSLDPIGFCDNVTGRWFSSQLQGTTSLAAFTDDDGANWTPSEGGPGNGGVDHQTIGGGPYAAGMSGLTSYPHAVYYCSQDLVAALCARSDNGGLTFNPAVPAWTSECTGLHGHVKVAPNDGTVYVPNKNCGGHVGVAVSTDNGLNWAIRPVPQAGTDVWDPSVALASDGTVYLGYGDSDGHPKVAVSHDQGRTWTNIRDVGVPFGIEHTAFSAVVAGDPDRAAYSFLGTPEPSAGAMGDNPNWPGEWHLYVAHTYDGGDTWTTVDATPADPVQRGTICAGGFNGCPNGTRNLLDFNGADVDHEGRVLLAYADGCVASCITGPPNSFTAIAGIARQVNGKRLNAKFDVLGVPAAPAVFAKASNGPPPANVVSWQAPDDHGSAITGYKLYRRTASTGSAVIASVPGTARSYSDSAIVAGESYFYKVTATNGQGEGPACQEVQPEAATPPENPCEEPGVRVLTDANGDALDGDPAHDVQWLSIAEPRSIGLGKVEFLLKVASLQSVPIDTTWPVIFKASDGTDHFVRMKTNQIGQVSFGYGTGTSVSGSATAADPASRFTADGTIRIVVARDAIGAQTGGKLTEFLVRIRIESGVGSAITPDNMPDSLGRAGSYTVHGNENCTVPMPDLVIASNDIGLFAERVKGGELVTFLVSVHNNGTADANDVKVRFLLDGVQLGVDQTINKLASDSVSSVSVQWSTKGAKGDHTIQVTADPGNAIAESSESNNSASKVFTVKGNKTG